MGGARGRARRPLGRPALLTVLLVGAAVGCSSDPVVDGGRQAPREGTYRYEPSASSSPFTVAAGDVPEGWHLVSAGLGTKEQSWGSDTTGTDSPVTLLRRRSDGSVVRVAAQSWFDVYGPAWSEESDGFELPGDDVELIEVGGHRAHRFDAVAADGDRPARAAHVAVLWDDDVVLDVAGASGDVGVDDLIAVAEAVAPGPDHVASPVIAQPPDGFEVVGAVDVDASFAIDAEVSVGDSRVPGGPSSHAAGWARDPVRRSTGLAVLTLPGRSADLDALAEPAAWPGLERTVDVWRTELAGRPALRVATSRPNEVEAGLAQRTVVAETAWGDLVVATSRLGYLGPDDDRDPGALATFAELDALAAGVGPGDDAAWETFTVEAAGGPGLHPDAGRTELLRGRGGGVAWLLQTGEPGPSPWAGSGFGDRIPGDEPDGTEMPDGCLKLEVGARACPRSQYGGQWTYAVDGHAVTVFVWPTEVAGFRMTPSDGGPAVEVDAVPVPGGRAWVAAFDRDVGSWSCAPEAPGVDGVQPIDAAGVPLPC